MNNRRQANKWSKSYYIVIVVTLLLVMALTAQANDGPAITSDGSNGLDDNNSPIRALAAMDVIPLLNEPAHISCTLTSALDAPDSTALIVLPAAAKLVSGNESWRGDLVAGEPVTFGVTVEFTAEGDTAVSCRVHKQLDAENSFGDLATLYLSIGQQRSIEGFAPLPLSEQIRLGSLLEPGDGQLVSETAGQWKWNYAERTVPSPPSLEPSLTPASPDPNPPKAVQGDLTVTGTWSYYDRDDSFVGSQEQLVEAVRGDNGDHLAWCYTDLVGNYSCGPFTNPGAAGVRTLIHSYTSYNPNPDLLIVKHPDFSGTAPANSFRVQTGVVVFADGTHDIGSWFINNGDNYERAHWAQRDLTDTWRHIFFSGDVSGSTAGPSTVLWKIDSTDGTYYVLGGEVHLAGEDPLSDTVVGHEYTHNIMYTVYNSYPSTPNCNPHSIPLISSQGCAWTEGWAEFIPSVVNNDPTFRWPGGSSLNLENPTWSTGGWDDGDAVEGRVVGALWDIYDSTNEGDDQYTEPADFAPFWDVFYNQDDNNFSEFWQAWLSFGYNNSSAGPLMSMYQSTIDYRIGPGNDDFDNAFNVGGVPYTVNDWDTSNATTQGDDPVHPCGSGATPKQSRSVWYQFSPGSSTSVNINTDGSNYDTVLSVWTGSFGSLTNVACDDDGGTGVQSSLDVSLSGGTTYIIEVSSYGNSGGGLMDLSITELLPEIDLLTTALNFVVPAGGTDSDSLAFDNIGAGDLNWSLNWYTGAVDVLDDWTFFFSWGCTGSFGSAVVTFHPDNTFTVSDGSSGTWVLTDNYLVLTFPTSGAQYFGFVAGDHMAGRSSGPPGDGCWEAERVTSAVVPLVSAERTLSGSPAADPGAETNFTSPVGDHVAVPGGPWLDVAPSAGVLAPASGQNSLVSVDANFYGPGEYGLIVLYSDDPDEALLAVPVTMEVAIPDAVLRIDPAYDFVGEGQNITVDVMVDDVTDLYGVALEIGFDPTVVEVVDDDLGTAGIQITPGSCPSADFVVQNSADNGLGVINYDVTSLSPSPPCNGTGVVASITFSGKAGAAGLISPVQFDAWLLADINGLTIPATTQDGALEVIVVDGGIEGAVILQGRSDHSGAEVCAFDGALLVACDTTNASGDYSISLPAGTYDVTVEMALYLDSEMASVSVVAGATTTLPNVELKAGDFNDDDIINILDLAFVGGHYGLPCGDPGWDDRADFNLDCVVNILDLVLVGGNYLETSPVNWP